MTSWTIPLLNVSITFLAIANVMCAWQIRKLSRRVFDLELDKMARDTATEFIKRIYSTEAAMSNDCRQAAPFH